MFVRINIHYNNILTVQRKFFCEPTTYHDIFKIRLCRYTYYTYIPIYMYYIYIVRCLRNDE